MRSFSFFLAPPRHPVARLVLGLAGLALLGFFTVFGLVLAAMVVAGLALRRIYLHLRGTRPVPPSHSDPHIIEGEFSVVEKARLPR